ncbi:F1-ATPase chaperone Atp12 [Schizosaccharomyces japonicus yFS275]|uniref:F1-ATPase chaperone Atp12 n=1 Tax=Schizosaccharomyces japonicus (strain yFS275 / FY16936) TaxID=402676 RepID=B6JY44_SCHJY|nr:F1-ATPase chaperone Atp12 [Schizosaccharomyces japonicus yFS275]EEB06462.1 F1-ATPase chaperone Atp12 [Schizosaccharomyces japonicus yFS275]
MQDRKERGSLEMRAVWTKNRIHGLRQTFSFLVRGYADARVSTVKDLKQNLWKRLWKETHVEYMPNDCVRILLGNKPLQTTNGFPVVLPKTMESVAHLVAREWNQLTPGSIGKYQLSLTSLVTRAIDMKTWKEQKNGEETLNVLYEQLMNYLDSDTVLVYAPSHEYEGKLLAEQKQRYFPLKANIEELFGLQLKYLDGDKGLIPNKQPLEVKRAAFQWLRQQNHWRLACFEQITRSMKSFVIGMHMTMNKMDTKNAIECANLETKYQTEKWGRLKEGKK